jgi:hypothetical protein
VEDERVIQCSAAASNWCCWAGQGGAAAVQLLALALEFHIGTSAAQGPMSPEQPYDGRLAGTAARTDGRELRGQCPYCPAQGNATVVL